MPFYNCARTLAYSIGSILWQTYENWELLLCDDGSKDGSLDVASSFSDERIVLWSDGRNKKLQVRLNECIARARGKYFARMDGDDIAYPARLEKQVEFLERHPDTDLLGAWVIVFGRNAKPLGARRGAAPHEAICRTPFSGFHMVHPTYCGRLSWFKKYLYEETATRIQDQELLLRSFNESRFANLPEILLGLREECIPIRKALRSHVIRARLLHAYFRRHSDGLHAMWQAGKEIVRTAVLCVGLATGAGPLIQRRRVSPASQSEVEEWLHVWSRLNGKCPPGSPAC
jgi:glycosyltransferase involved in cell wall biosynthesis